MNYTAASAREASFSLSLRLSSSLPVKRAEQLETA